MVRRTGILMPIASLKGNYGVGDFGTEAFKFVDILASNGIKIWQILPLHPLGYGYSPYQPYSSYAGDIRYVSLEKLIDMGYLSKVDEEDLISEKNVCDFKSALEIKDKYLRIAFENYLIQQSLDDEIKAFVKKYTWVEQYAVYITFKKRNNMKSWVEWKSSDKLWATSNRVISEDLKESVLFEIFSQFIFYRQWFELKKYANTKNVDIMGDIPIYVGLDSCDVWMNQKIFLLDSDSNPTFIAGVPPDFFSESGQRWGNPLYDWDYLEKTNFKFWIERLGFASSIYDITRIDHFRAFDTYWKIPVECPTAIEGEWIEAPGYALFDEIYKNYPSIQLVAEDLGLLRPEVLELRDHYGLSGMKIVQFELDPKENNNDFEETSKTIIYTGTHDNNTIQGWVDTLTNEEIEEVKDKLHNFEGDTLLEKIVNRCLLSKADLVIFPIQDVLGLGDESRINTPGTLGSPNWEWKITSYDSFEKEMGKLSEKLIKSKR